MELNSFIKESNLCKNHDELLNIFRDFLKSSGINKFMMVDLYSNYETSGARKIEFITGYPDTIFDDFINNSQIDYDSVYDKALNSISPFSWKNSKKSDSSGIIFRVINRESESKVCSGIGVPIHQPLGRVTGIAFIDFNREVVCCNNTLSILQAAANQFFMVYNLLNTSGSTRESIVLTEREREVMQLIAKGNSKSEIANLLGISQSSVKRHCESVFNKLEVRNLPSAVSKALKMGLINLYYFFICFINLTMLNAEQITCYSFFTSLS